MLIITDEFLEANKSSNNGWNKLQFECIGLSFPPSKGWKNRLIGTVINDEQARMFVALRNAKLKKEKKKNLLAAEMRAEMRIQAQAKKLELPKHKRPRPVINIDPKSISIQPGKNKYTDRFIASSEFLQTYEWRKLRMQALTLHGARCQCCGATPKDGIKLHVDHIKPRKKYPDLALDLNNLQILCEVCNHGKGNWNSTDWRG